MSEVRKPIPDAVATIYGWAHPRTGELLVSLKGLPNPVQNYKVNCPFPKKEETTEERIDTVEIAAVTEEVIDSPEVVAPKPARSRKKV